MTTEIDYMQDAQTNTNDIGAGTSIPDDKTLTGMRHVLDTDCMQERLATWLSSAFGELLSCSIGYVRYKPETNCIVGYRLQFKYSTENYAEKHCYAKIFSGQEYKDACQKLTSKRWQSVGSTDGILLIPEFSAIVYCFPNDAILTGLRSLTKPKRLQRLLYQYLTEYPEDSWRISDSKLRLEVASYKPERRAVLHIRTKATHRSTGEKQPLSLYIRFYADDRGAHIIEQIQALRNSQPQSAATLLPEPVCYLQEERALLLRSVSGIPLTEVTDGNDLLRFTELTGAALAELHSSSDAAYPSPSDKELIFQMRQTIIETASYLSSLLPESRELISSLCAKLTSSVDEIMTHIGVTHGDFHPGQVICQEDSAGIIDFDRAQAGPQLTDLANFIANLRWHALANTQFPLAEAEKCLTDSYERTATSTINREELSFWIACRLFLLAVGPFRQFERRWSESVLQVLAECDNELATTPHKNVPDRHRILDKATDAEFARPLLARYLSGALGFEVQIDKLSIPRVFVQIDGTVLIQYVLTLRSGSVIMYGELCESSAECHNPIETGDKNVFVAELQMALHIFPYDKRLRLLGDCFTGVSQTSWLQPKDFQLADSELHFSPEEVVAYRFGKRSVIRGKLHYPENSSIPPRRAFLKISRPRHATKAFAAYNTIKESMSQTNAPHFSLATNLFTNLGQGLIISEAVSAPTLYSMFDNSAADPDSIYSVCNRIGLLLRNFQSCTTPNDTSLATYSAGQEVAMLEERVSATSSVAPQFRKRLQQGLAGMGDCPKEASATTLVLSHRDFYDKQLFVSGTEITLIDFDTLALADPALDVANFLAHLSLRMHQNLISESIFAKAQENFVEGYYTELEERTIVTSSQLRWWYQATMLRLATLYALRPQWRHLTDILIGDSLAGLKCELKR